VSLDVYLTAVRTTTVFESNVTHNLNRMAQEAGIYQHLWRPDEIGISRARQLIEPLAAGVELMRAEPDRFRAFNPANGWGSYDAFVPWVEAYLQACRDNPDAEILVRR
jgi:hypothetical protein